MKRVISEPDNVDAAASHDQRNEYMDANYLAMDQSPQTDLGERPPAVVEMDDRMDMDGVNRTRTTSENGTSTSSSLSDGNEQEEQMHRHEPRISADSSVSSSVRTSRTSQNGSGNWGWFDEVLENNRAPKKEKNRGDAQAMPSNNNGECDHFTIFWTGCGGWFSTLLQTPDTLF